MVRVDDGTSLQILVRVDMVRVDSGTSKLPSDRLSLFGRFVNC